MIDMLDWNFVSYLPAIHVVKRFTRKTVTAKAETMDL